MLYPSTWIQQAVAEEYDGYVVVSDFFTPEEEIGSYASVTITIDNMPRNTNIEDYLDEGIDAYTQDQYYRDFQVLSSSTDDFTLAGLPAYSFEATYTDAEFGSQHLLEVGTIIDNKGYFIQYFADPPVYRSYFPIADRMIESFQTSQQLQPQEEEGQQQQLPQQQQNEIECDPSYPDVCISPPPPNLNCGDISERRFTVLSPDPHGFDRENDGIGCES